MYTSSKKCTKFDLLQYWRYTNLNNHNSNELYKLMNVVFITRKPPFMQIYDHVLKHKKVRGKFFFSNHLLINVYRTCNSRVTVLNLFCNIVPGLQKCKL